MGRRSRKRRTAPVEAPAAERRVREHDRRARSEARAAEARAGLDPLAEGERPAAVTVAAVVAALLALANLVLLATGYEVREGGGGPAGAILFAIIMGAAAWGMWRGRYWAVLGFQALLGLTMFFAVAGLVVAQDVWAALLALAVLVGAGLLFYRLIRAMARIQMPERRPGGAR